MKHKCVLVSSSHEVQLWPEKTDFRPTKLETLCFPQFESENPEIANTLVSTLNHEEHDTPVLIVQLKSLQTFFFYFSRSNEYAFEKPFVTLNQMDFIIQKAFGRFLIGEFKREPHTKMLELDGTNYQQV